MSAPTNQQLFDVLLSLKGDVGEIKGKLDAHQTAFLQHLKDDAQMAQDIKDVQLAQARTKGAAKTWGVVATGFATVAGAAAGFFGGRHY